jgi:biopolymer transport protein ExbD
MLLESAPRPRRSAIGLASLIDVVFILLLFFMLASSLTRLHTVPVSVGAGEARPQAAREQPNPLRLRVLAAGGYLLGEVPIEDGELTQALAEHRARDPELRLVITPDDTVALQRLMVVLDSAADVGVQGVRLQ